MIEYRIKIKNEKSILINKIRNYKRTKITEKKLKEDITTR